MLFRIYIPQFYFDFSNFYYTKKANEASKRLIWRKRKKGVHTFYFSEYSYV